MKRVNNNFLTNNNLTDVNNNQNYYQQKYLNQIPNKKITRSFSIQSFGNSYTNRTRSFSVIPSKAFRYLERLVSVGN